MKCKDKSCRVKKINYGKPKGHLDTQLFPECKGTKYDRDIVKKTREKRNKASSESWWKIAQLEEEETLKKIAQANKCNCGSGLEAEELVDARGIFCCMVCSRCKKSQMAKYRPEIFENANYWADEPIDED